MMKNDNKHLIDAMERFRTRANTALEACLPEANIHPCRLHEAMRYVTLDGGKRFRPILVYSTAEALGVPLETADAPACAVELIHAYSLVHDDLPAMDNDDLRRGKPTCHRAFDEATAILTGDALQSLAFQILAQENPALANSTRLRMLDILAKAAGSRGMAGGQAIDLEAVGRQLTIAELEDMHIHKTGALIRASVLLGALCSPSLTESELEHLDRYARWMGLAFQVWDDVLDVEGTTAELGKPQGSDQARNKPTYPAILGLAETKERAQEFLGRALQSLDVLGERGKLLAALAGYVVSRRH